ncbi:hypothetical protein NUACC21_32300 [Scytonema sp. NUACC21]
MKQFDYLEEATESFVTLPSESLLTYSFTGDVNSNRQLDIIPVERNLQSATDIESMRFVSDEVAMKTAKHSRASRFNSVKSSTVSPRKKVDANSTTKTQKLLDGAIAYAWSTIKSHRKPPVLTRARWVWRLAGSYHLAHYHPRLIEEAAQIFAEAKRWNLAQWATQKAREERGHDKLALLDIQLMGYDAEAVVNALVPPAAVSLVNYCTHSVRKADPIGCVGYAYTMERLAICRGKEYIQAVEAVMPSNTRANRFLKTHSSVGDDVKHVEEAVEMIGGLTPEERTQIATACYETALLCFRPPHEDYISEEELHNVLKPLEQKTIDKF